MCKYELGPHPATDRRATNLNNIDNLLRQFDIVKSGMSEKSEKSQIFLKNYSKFALHHEAQRLVREVVPEGNNFTKCYVCPIGPAVNVVRNPVLRKAYFRQVVTCANPFLCPVCAPRIRSKRSQEIGKAFDQWKKADPKNTVYMITLTFQHSVRDSLFDVMSNLKKASKSFWEHRQVKKAFRSAGMVGRITAFEVTYGSNGWHPHFHIVVFCKRYDFDVKAFKHLWLQSLDRSNLSGSAKCAFNFIEARDGSEYLSKISLEIGLSNNKIGRRGGLSPFQLLEKSISGERFAGKRYQELWLYMRESHTHVLQWSKGLKAYFGIGEISDEEICSGLEQGFISFACLASKLFIRCNREDKSVLIAYASVGDIQMFSRYLSLVISREHLDRVDCDISSMSWRFKK